MLAELAAANAAYAVIRQTIANSGDLARCASQIGELVGAKESLEKKVKKKRAAHQTTDFEEFMALERINEQTAQLEQLMIYSGRPGMLQDWRDFQRNARIQRRKAEEARLRKRKEMMELAGYLFLILVLISGAVGLVWWMAFLKGYV